MVDNALIGNYIHLTGRGYRLYGFYRRKFRGEGESKNQKSPQLAERQAVDAVHASIKSTLQQGGIPSKVQIKQMEDTLNNFFGRHNDRSKASSGLDQQIDNIVVKALNDQFKNQINEDKIDFSKGLVEAINDEGPTMDKLTRTVTRTAEKKTDKRINPLEAQKIVKQMNDELKNVQRDISEEDYNKLVKRLDELNNDVNALIKAFEDTLKGSLSGSEDEVQKKINAAIKKDMEKLGFTNKGLKKQEESIQTRINELINLYFKKSNLSKIRGEYFEYLASLLPVIAGKKALSAVTEDMQEYFAKTKVGSGSETFEVNSDLFGVLDKRGNNVFKHEELDESGHFKFLVEDSSGQGKVDVSFEWENAPVRASLKNYYLETPKFVSTGDSNLLYMMQDVLPAFVNHFLNLHVQHNTRKANFFPGGKIDNKLGPNAKNLQQRSRNAARQMIVMKTLSGATYGKSINQTANLFIINDSSSGKVKVFSMTDLIDKINRLRTVDELKGLSVKVGGKNIMELGSSGIIPNKPGDGRNGVERIKQILIDVHKLKVHAAINSSSILDIGKETT